MMQLSDVLDMFKQAGVLRGSVKMDGDCVTELAVEFPPTYPAEADIKPGRAPVPGGWKTMQDLDAPFDGDGVPQ